MEFASRSDSGSSGLTLRALCIGVVLIIANSYWLNEATWAGRILHTYISLFINTVFCLFLLVLMNFLLRRACPQYAFHRSELLVIYVMVLMVSTLSGNTNMGYLLYILAYPFWFETAENDWLQLFGGHIPRWFTVRDKEVLRGFYEGESSFFMAQYVEGWLATLLVWSAFIFVLYVTLICMNVILRKQFAEHERLTFPITWLPLEMGNNPTGFFRNRLMWAGFGVAGGIEVLNGINFLYPAIPSVPIGIQNVSHLFQEKPWNAVGTILFTARPFVIGLAFFMPLDLAFSSWFFYFFGKFLLVLKSVLGWRTDLYLDEQSEGAWIGLGILALWIGRRHLKRVFKQAMPGKNHVDDSAEPMPYKWAVWGTICGVLCVLLFGYKAGASLWCVLLFFGIYFLMAISLTKVRAGLGPPMHEVIGKDPAATMVSALGTRMIGASSLTVLSFFFWLNRVNTAHPMPNQLEAFHIGRQARIDSRKLLAAMLIGLAVGIPVTFITYLGLSYDFGGYGARHTLVPMSHTFHALQTRLIYLTDVDYAAMLAMGTGLGFTLFLIAMKLRFFWWPFHPIGYVIGTGRWGDMSFYWLPVLVSWAIKAVVLRHGGLQAYRKAIPFFAGLILGDYVGGSIWGVIGVVLKIPTYSM